MKPSLFENEGSSFFRNKRDAKTAWTFLAGDLPRLTICTLTLRGFPGVGGVLGMIPGVMLSIADSPIALAVACATVPVTSRWVSSSPDCSSIRDRRAILALTQPSYAASSAAWVACII